MTPEELRKQRADEAAKKEQAKKDEALSQQKLQLQQVLGEVLAPIQTSLVDLQGKYQTLQEQQIQAESKSTKTPEQEMDDMLDDMNDDDKYDKLSNKQMLDIMGSSVEGVLKANAQSVRESIAEELKPTLDKVGTIEKATMQIIAGMGVKDARAKHEDFDKHLPEIKEVLTQYPGMDYSDAYMLAKSKKAGAVPPKDHIETEKPQSNATVPSGQPNPTQMTTENMEAMANRGRESRSGEQLHGKVGFMALANAAADKILDAHD